MKKLYSFTRNGKDFVIVKDEIMTGWKYLLFGDYTVGYYKRPVSEMFKDAEKYSLNIDF